MTLGRRALLRAAVAGAVCCAAPALASAPDPFMTSYGSIDAPPGYLEWRSINPIAALYELDTVADSPAVIAAMRKAHAWVRQNVRYRTETHETWQVALTEGDCEDLALRTLMELWAAGLPRGALRIAACWAGEQPHAVLTVETTAGTYVVDYLNPGVWLWHQLPYQWHSRESVGLRWNDLSPPRDLAHLLERING